MLPNVERSRIGCSDTLLDRLYAFGPARKTRAPPYGRAEGHPTLALVDSHQSPPTRHAIPNADLGTHGASGRRGPPHSGHSPRRDVSSDRKRHVSLANALIRLIRRPSRSQPAQMGSTGGPTSGAVKVLALRRAGVCGCGAHLPVGARAGWDRVLRAVVCMDCFDEGLRLSVSGPEASTVRVLGAPEPRVTVDCPAGVLPARQSPMEPSPSVVDVGDPGSSLQASMSDARRRAKHELRHVSPALVASCWQSRMNQRQ